MRKATSFSQKLQKVIINLLCYLYIYIMNEKLISHLTEAHAAESLKNCQYNNPADVTFAFDTEH